MALRYAFRLLYIVRLDQALACCQLQPTKTGINTGAELPQRIWSSISRGLAVKSPIARARARAPDRPLMIAISGQYTKAADRILAEMSGFSYFSRGPSIRKC